MIYGIIYLIVSTLLNQETLQLNKISILSKTLIAAAGIAIGVGSRALGIDIVPEFMNGLISNGTLQHIVGGAGIILASNVVGTLVEHYSEECTHVIQKINASLHKDTDEIRISNDINYFAKTFKDPIMTAGFYILGSQGWEIMNNTAGIGRPDIQLTPHIATLQERAATFFSTIRQLPADIIGAQIGCDLVRTIDNIYNYLDN